MHNDCLNFDFEIPNGYSLIDKKDYEKYRISPSTLEVLVDIRETYAYTLSLNRDDEFTDEEDYYDLVNLNAENMKKMGMNVHKREDVIRGDKKIHLLYSTFKKLEFMSAFFAIRNVMVCVSVECSSQKLVDDLFTFIDSIKVLEDC